MVVAVFAKGDDALTCLTQVVREHHIDAAQITAVGAFARAEVGYFDRDKADYDHIPVDEQVEVLSLLGDVATKDGAPAVHAHTVLGRRDGSVVGGHLLAGRVWPTLEVILTEVAPELAKRVDAKTGLALIDLDLL
ncbi:PPC domain-containing DNA-binding protein [Krasilnikovia sp. M28-CT-15]|uniref:PPC domain-containing DNA-binding protein n=1 Tax=Krasilnikovia sp. M28-CT-15 TaxID=3373540 RepID=UPI00399D33B7